jgi:hypothetical protein
MILLVLSGIAHDLEANQQFHIARWSAGSVHADALDPGEGAEVAPILGKRILCGTLIFQTRLSVYADRDRSAGRSAAANADVKLRRPISARCASCDRDCCEGHCGTYGSDSESSHDVLVSNGVSTPIHAGGSPHVREHFSIRLTNLCPAIA